MFDPRATETSRVVDEHHFIKPSTDVFFLLGMLHLIQKNDWIELGHLKNHLTDLDKLKEVDSFSIVIKAINRQLPVESGFIEFD